MKIYKKRIYFIFLVFLLPGILFGCKKINNDKNKNELVVPIGIETITEITPIEVKVDEETWIGVDMATINYASDNRIVIHGNFGLFVYDLNSETIIRGIDVKSIGCGSTQGDNVCIVSVSEDSNIIRLHPSSSEDMYIYNVQKNTLIKTKYGKLEDELKTLPIDESYVQYDEEYTYSYIRLIDEEVSYLRCPRSNMAIDLQYIKNDKVYDIFKQ